ncbi:MAG TPA: ATP-dependent 6-phosphofructokinase [Phycisphaerales bacterium]|nr:ATP-dependent 6-phosphofructokinase [Phycisphaerales bacterium]HMP36456.1 ATP-dependent 6-phosphofructokinase [Phycisphaerales bacterium]
MTSISSEANAAPASTIKRIGVLTGGGDCPGLNAVIRAVAKTAIYEHGIEVMGIRDGFLGLIENRINPLNLSHVSGILHRGGTILGTNNKCNPRRHVVGRRADGSPIFEDVVARCVENVRAHRLDALIVIGGDGTISASSALVEAGINVIGVPKTIDNDIIGTEITFGFLTAVATATEALDRLHSTADSHHRVMVCEVMGRNAGWIALTAGVASGSDVILIPEVPFDLDHVGEFVARRMAPGGAGFAIVVVAEGATHSGGDKVVRLVDPTSPDPIRLGGVGHLVATELERRVGIETRTTVLGHVQRGGPPIAADRILATYFGYHAINLLMHGGRARMVVRQNNVFTDIDILEVAHRQRLVPTDHPLIAAAKAVNTCFGDGLPRTAVARDHAASAVL